MKDLYVHSCCGPCLYASWPFLPEEASKLAVFYNPNIEPPSEWAKRAEAFLDVCNLLSCDGVVTVSKYHNALHADLFAGRCSFCYDLRLSWAMNDAKKRGFRFFTTTLLSSPRQNQSLLRRILLNLSEAVGMDVYWFAEDERDYELRVHELKQKHVHVQNYCGCFGSLVERETNKWFGLWK